MNTPSSNRGSWHAVLACVALLQLTACDREPVQANEPAAARTEAAAGTARTVATVDGTAITEVHVAAAVRAGTPPADATASLVDKQLMADAAVRLGIDKEPVLRAAIDNAQRELLARAYLESQLAAVPEPSPAAIAAYYRDQPAMFSERRVYRLREVDIQVPAERGAEIESHVREVKSLDELMTWLRQRQLPFQTGISVRTAEQLPLPMLAPLHMAKPGQVVGHRAGSSLLVVQVLEVQPAPMSLAEATPLIRNLVRNVARRELATQRLEELRAKAKVTTTAASTTPVEAVTRSQ